MGVPELGPALGYWVRGDERTERGGQQDEMGTRVPAQKGCWPSHEQDWELPTPRGFCPPVEWLEIQMINQALNTNS